MLEHLSALWRPATVLEQVLDDFQNDPAAAQRHLQRPEIMANIQKLVKAGIVKLG